MKKNNILFILILLVVFSIGLNIFLFTNKKINFVDKRNNINTEFFEKVEKINSYNELRKYNNYFKKIEIKKGLIVDKNTIENVTSLCSFLEGESNFMYNRGRKVFLDKEKRNIIKLIESNLSEEELVDFKNLKNGKITGDYEVIDSLDNKNIEEQLNILGRYMLFITNSKEFEIYYNKYFDILKEKKNVSENYIIPIVLVEFYKNKKCHNFIDNNFISY